MSALDVLRLLSGVAVLILILGAIGGEAFGKALGWLLIAAAIVGALWLGVWLIAGAVT